MNLAPEPKYLENFHKSWFSKRGLDPAGLDADLQVWMQTLAISASVSLLHLDADSQVWTRT